MIACCCDARLDLSLDEHAGLELPAALSTRTRTFAERASASTAGLISATRPSNFESG